MENGLPIIVFIIFVIVGIAAIAWHCSRSRSLLQQWASGNGYVILHREYRNVVKGPFFWTSSKGQTVYYVKIRDREGNVRTGWVRCGSWWLGLMSDKTEVRWENER
jgi:hypothetical protein